MNWIRPLAEVNLTDSKSVGGKAAHLGALIRAGFPVPPGFVITVDAFVDHFGQITDPLVRPPTPRLSSELMAEVSDALITHLGRDTDLAVRSSSTEEDGQFASFAGQHSTYYFVNPMRVDQAIVDCWMSLWSSPATAYRRAGWGDIDSGDPLRMAVIVQRMVRATRSGVAFSRHPVEDSNDCVIEASWGLGAALVDGRVTPDQIRISEDNQLKRYKTNDKRYQVLPTPGDPRLQEVPPNLRTQPVLSTSEAEHISNIAAQLETLFDAPQDVEWAYEDDTLHLLQSRPITTRADVCDTDATWVLFKPLTENFTEPLTPLTEQLFAKVLPKIGAFYRGRLYVSPELVRKLIPAPLSLEEVAQMMFLRPEGRPTDRAPFKLSLRSSLKAAALLGGAFLVDGAQWLRARRVSKSDLSGYAEVVSHIKEDQTISLSQSIRTLVWGTHAMQSAYKQMFTLNISAGRYFIHIGVLNHLVQRFAPEYDIAELPATYHGDNDMHSLDLLNDLQHLSALLHADENLLKKVVDSTELPVGHPFTDAFENFLRQYGHRGPREMEFAAPRWRESPAELLRLIASTPEADEAARNLAHGNTLAARDALHQQLKPWQRQVIKNLTDSIRGLIALRENTRHYHIMAFACMRDKILDLQARLLSEQKLKKSGDIFFLHLNEIEALQQGWLEVAAAQQTARTRRRQWHADARADALETINLDLEQRVPGNSAGQQQLTGTCASPGKVRGRARVVMSPHQGIELKAGDIMIAPYTDPAWTPLFSRCSAVVVGMGSFLSHARTIARELQVPCLVDVQHCTELIRDGDEIYVDATHGTLSIIITTQAASTGVSA